jgi:two-component system nitrate/nitrite response regulator NarL
VVRDGLAALLRHVGANTTAHDAHEALAVIDQTRDLDAIVLDLMLPGMEGFQAISRFGRKRPDLPVIVVSSSEDPQDVRGALS